MSSEETDVSSSSEENYLFHSGDDDENNAVVGLAAGLPYQNEPLARAVVDEEGEEEEEELDCDGIAFEDLEARFENRRRVDQWCTCGQCEVGLLSGAREYRCCREIEQAQGKLECDGSIETIGCITLHEDFRAITNAANLAQAGPLLKDKQGRKYKQRAGQSRNEYLRAVAYRWTIRYIFGYLGWDNTRPLSACIYSYIRKKFHSGQHRGYASAQERQ